MLGGRHGLEFSWVMDRSRKLAARLTGPQQVSKWSKWPAGC